MSIFRETKIVWNDTTYTLVPSMRLLHAIEAGDRMKGIEPISLAAVTRDAGLGRPQAAKMAHVVELAMHHAGATDFTEDEFYQAVNSLDPDERGAAIECWHSVTTALSPVPKQGKTAAAQSEK